MDYNPYKHSRRPIRNRKRTDKELAEIAAPVIEQINRIFPMTAKKEPKQ